MTYFLYLDCTGWEYSHNYRVTGFEEHDLKYTFREVSTCCQKCWCANLRKLTLTLVSPTGEEILRFEKALKCVDCFSDCCYPNWTTVCTRD